MQTAEMNRDMLLAPAEERVEKVTEISLLDLMLIGADESKQCTGTWVNRNGDRCALGAIALGAQKLGLM